MFRFSAKCCAASCRDRKTMRSLMARSFFSRTPKKLPARAVLIEIQLLFLS